jgi:hypothetical protein
MMTYLDIEFEVERLFSTVKVYPLPRPLLLMLKTPLSGGRNEPSLVCTYE